MADPGSAPGRPVSVMVVSHEASRTGAPKVAVHLLSALRRAGAHTIVVHRWGGPMRIELDAAADDNRSELLSKLRVLLRRWPPTKGLAWRVERWAVGRTIGRVAPDIIWCNTVLASVYASVAMRRGIPCVVYSHEGRPLAEAALSRAELLSVATGAATAPIAVGCSTETAEILQGLLGSSASALVLHSPVDVAAIRREAGSTSARDARPTVVAIGKGDLRKGIAVFNEAAQVGAARGVDCDWVWVGDVHPDLRVAEVDYRGEVATAAPILGRCAVFVMPSLMDSFPLVVLEAMALSKPIVSTRLCGTVEQLGDTAVLIEPGNVSEMVDAVDELIRDPEVAAGLGAAAAVRCEQRWDIPAFDRRVDEILSSIVRTEQS